MRTPAPVLALATSLLLPSTAAAQARMTMAYEVAVDRWQYRFENPSTFEGDELVPHEYQQTYWGDNQWVSLRAQYRWGGRELESAVAFTPQRTTRGDDFDTFYLPSGDVAVSGTTGNVSQRSLRVRQSVSLGRAAGLDWRVGYQFRRDRNQFHPSVKIVTHTRPPSRTVSRAPGRETTFSNVHEVRVGVSRDWQRGPGWRTRASLDVAPTTNATLTTRLPDKYPGRDINSTAVVLTLRPSLTITRGVERQVFATVSYVRTFSYSSAMEYRVHAVRVAVGLGFGTLR